jgi:hypothetical protein
MKHLINTYFAQPELLLRVTAYAPGSLTAGASAADSGLVIKDIKVKLYRGSEINDCIGNKL